MKNYFYLFSCIINLTLCSIEVMDTYNNLTIRTFIDANAQFGRDFEDGTMAYLVESSPLLACNSSIVPPPVRPSNESNILFVSLIKRGNCSFEYKVKIAQNSGYEGVIIYNNINDDVLHMQRSDDSTENLIPSRMVGLRNGYELKTFTYIPVHNRFIVIFIKDLDFNPQYYIIAFLGFVSLGFLLIGVGFAVKLCRDCVKRRSNRLKKCHLNKIPIKKFVKGQDHFDTCAICLEDFIDGDKLRILPCNHAYHMKCIDPWLLKQKRNCPICKNKIKIPGRDEESDDGVNVTASSESVNVMVDEHTPLINTRSDDPIFNYNERGISFAPKQASTIAQNCYENPCIDDNADNTSQRERTDSPQQMLSINSDTDIHVSTESTSNNTKPQNLYIEDLIKMV